MKIINNIDNLRSLYNTNCDNEYKIKPSKWTEPTEKACTIYIGCDLNGEYVVNSKTTKKQIDFVMSKESRLELDGKIIHLDDILIETRRPTSGLQHSVEFNKAVLEYFETEYFSGLCLKPSLKSKANFNSKLYKVSPLKYILEDRALRFRLRKELADVAPLAIIRLEDDCIVMFELYCGHHWKQKIIHLKSHDFKDVSYEKKYIDSVADDVEEYEYNFAKTIGLSSTDIKEIISVAHDTLLCDHCKVIINGIEK